MSCVVPGSPRRKDQKGGCAADSVAKPARCQRARPRCCTCSRVLPTTDMMPASRDRCLPRTVSLSSRGTRLEEARARARARRLEGEARRRRHEGDGPRRATTSSRDRSLAWARVRLGGRPQEAGPAPSALPAAAAGASYYVAAVGPKEGGRQRSQGQCSAGASREILLQRADGPMARLAGPGHPNPRFLAPGPEGTGRRDQAISSI